MIVILYLLALAMMATGTAAGVFGAPYVQLERGWTMIIAGSVVASSGAVLLGLSFVAQRIRRVEIEGARLRERFLPVDAASQLPSQATRGAVSGPAVATGTRSSPSSSADIAGPAASSQEVRAQETALKSQDPEPQDRHSQATPAVAAGMPPAPEATVTASPGTTIAGTYSSGGNDYVMYSDGSIHADTPAGHYRFASLDELKVFVAAGGERRPDSD